MIVLKPSDFPLMAVGANVYARSQSSPILTAINDHMAADIAFRLNYHESTKISLSASSGAFWVDAKTPVEIPVDQIVKASK